MLHFTKGEQYYVIKIQNEDMIRVIDDSGEDYLYHWDDDYFQRIPE